MTSSYVPGLTFAKAIAAAAIGGAALLIALDFGRADDAAGAAAGEAASIERRLKSVANIDLFATVDVPSTDLKVSTGSQYADAKALAEGRVAERWCYVERGQHGSPFAPRIDLGHQTGDAPPVLAGAGVAPEQAQLLGLSATTLAALADRHCRFSR